MLARADQLAGLDWRTPCPTPARFSLPIHIQGLSPEVGLCQAHHLPLRRALYLILLRRDGPLHVLD